MQDLVAILGLLCLLALANGVGVPSWANSACGLRGMVVMDQACMDSEPRPVDFRYAPPRPRPSQQMV
jgi:hypothetical protein